MEPIPQTSPGDGVAERADEYRAAIEDVLASGRYILGEHVSAFEEEFGAFSGLGHVAGVANGTDAIELALRALGVQPGESVFTVSHTAVATVAGIVRAGATPVFVDVDPDRYTMDPQRLREVIRSLPAEARPSVVLPVHLYGAPADMPGIVDVAAEAGLRVVEDCAQAHGASLHQQAVGTYGDAATFSFYPTKNLGAVGDAGAVGSVHEFVIDRVRELREYGWHERFVSHEVGSNSRLDELQAAVLRVALKHLPEDNRRRTTIADTYDRAFAGVQLVCPQRPSDGEHVFHQYVVRSRARDMLRTRLRDAGIGTSIHYPVPIHLQQAYRAAHRDPTTLPVTERLASEILSLPMYAQLTVTELSRVTAAVTGAAGRA